MKKENIKILPIVTWVNNPILRKRSKEIKIIDTELLELAEMLIETMREKDWMGLASPQIWQNIRMIATTKWKITKEWLELKWEEIMINPELLYKSKEMEVDKEWCLSIPGIMWKVSRHKEIKVKYINIEWKEKTAKLSWINARIVQHEIDHLDWILFVDKVIEEKKLNLEKLIQKK